MRRKAAHDLTYCIERTDEGLYGAAHMFREALAGRHGTVVRDCLSILRNRFAGDDEADGYLKDGPIAVVRFEQGDDVEAGQWEARMLRHRDVSSVIEQLLAGIGTWSDS